uniref:Alpha/beta hydrolase fold-3 domain-containing protein n=1 Tax=Malurus cyaneus samueli TaxID=2593467 RepID=A0A8C5U292_9PASS
MSPVIIPALNKPTLLLSFQILSFQQGKILEKLGICNDLTILRAVLDGIPPWRESKLLIKDLTVDEVPLRIYQPKSPPTGKRRGILYFHGGAGTFGSIRAFERVCRHMAKKCNSVVVSVGYRLSPENPYPGQYFDCLSATLYFMRNLEEYHVDPGLIILSGDSCGANFATVTRSEVCLVPYDRQELLMVSDGELSFYEVLQQTLKLQP